MLKINAYKIEVKGLVQGVGFRPFIYQIAIKYNIKGWVENTNKGVQIQAEGDELSLQNFIKSIEEKRPLASNITSLTSKNINTENFTDFKIVKSESVSDEITDISPDIAVCSECLIDMKEQKNRINYPFINCTNCGPRFTIIENLPYDREKTTMRDFIMCEDCKKEYENILDRRFHAQPIACDNCGPEYSLYKNDNKIIKGIDVIISNVIGLLNKGKIVAIKGLGGYFIACDALNDEAVKRLRQLKNREGKPFAVMFPNIEILKHYAEIETREEEIIKSWKRPIVVLKQKKVLSESISVGFDTIGSMLPYMPIHYLIFEKYKNPIVLTSGNVSDEPIVIDNNTAIEKLSEITDAVLSYNRDIYNRTDDSVVTVTNNKERIIRRSRSYVPSPINLNFNVEGILATGAELVNCFCIGKGKQAILSQHIGDLKNAETYDFFCETVAHFEKTFRFKPKLIVSDLHPDYFSTKYAKESGVEHVQVQHHHAHIASCMAEHNVNEKVIGVSFDGTGLGDDNNIWGGEFMICDFENYERINHFEYIPMPGGDKVTKEPWRMAVSYLHKYYNNDFLKLELPFLKNINQNNIALLLQAVDKNINSPLTSSAGRLFDAVAALINICPISKFHAEAPMRLESIIDYSVSDKYSYEINTTVSFKNTINEIVNDIKNNISQSIIATKFHNTVISVVFELVKQISRKYNINKVVLSGGTFQNKYVLENVENLLINTNFEVFSNERIPTNDGGIALGQLVIASKKINREIT